MALPTRYMTAPHCLTLITLTRIAPHRIGTAVTHRIARYHFQCLGLIPSTGFQEFTGNTMSMRHEHEHGIACAWTCVYHVVRCDMVYGISLRLPTDCRLVSLQNARTCISCTGYAGSDSNSVRNAVSCVRSTGVSMGMEVCVA